MATKDNNIQGEPRRKWALVIGIGKYESCPQLDNAENDANDMTNTLTTIGFHVTKLLNPKRIEIQNTLNNIENEIKSNDIVLLYFAGHGTQSHDINYLIPQDFPDLITGDLKKRAINAQKALESLSDAKPCAIIFLLDCCRDYRIPTADEQNLNRGVAVFNPVGLKDMQQANSLIAFACAAGTPAKDGKGQANGLFTKHLLNHITSNDDIFTVLTNVNKAVRTESNGQQIPFLSACLEEKIYLSDAKKDAPQQQGSVSLDALKILENDLKLDEEIGRGVFGVVHRGHWLSRNLTVAIKHMYLSQFTVESEETFYTELRYMHGLRHANIITLYGASMMSGKYAIVMEYMSLGSLYQVLHNEDASLEWPDRLSIALQIAKGVNYLHKLKPPTIHCDIKSLNVLLHPSLDGYLAKVCDFGLRQTRKEITRQSVKTHKSQQSLQWAAPEALRMKKYTWRSDVYSLGVVYWELATNQIPFEEYDTEEIRKFVLEGKRLQIPEATQSNFSELIEKCWAIDPNDRPICSEVIEIIERCIENEGSVPDLLKIADQDLRLDEQIGCGGFGTAYRGHWLSRNLTVAIKKLHVIQLTLEAEDTFFKELRCMHSLRHPNIITLYGACMMPGKYAIVMEYMQLGSLCQVLHNEDITLEWSDRLSIALQMAKGINYLHKLEPPMVHRDVKSLNILMHPSMDGYLVKICDFGLAEIRNETTRQSMVTQQLPCTLQWTAPEILRMKKHTLKSDIYSLGVVYWELATNEIPYEGHDASNIREFVLAGDRLAIPDTVQSAFTELIQMCWAHDQNERPTCSEVIETIEWCIEHEGSSPTTPVMQPAESEEEINHSFKNQTTKGSLSQESISSPTNTIKGKDKFLRLLARLSTIKTPKDTTIIFVKVLPDIPDDAQWEQGGVTVAGGSKLGTGNNQLWYPHGLYVDDDQTLIVADRLNDRIIQYSKGNFRGQIIAGGNNRGNRKNQLNVPSDVLIDKGSNSLIIADRANRRVARYYFNSSTSDFEVLIDNVACRGLAMDDQRNLYVSDTDKHEVRRYEIDRKDRKGVRVAGGNGKGNELNQLQDPYYLFVDDRQNLYISDWSNHRVMKWNRGALQGIVVAGGQGPGKSLKQLSYPCGVFVDICGAVYVAEGGNNRVTRWPKGTRQSSIIAGGNGYGTGANQLHSPEGLFIDVHENLYVVDCWNHRVQKFFRVNKQTRVGSK